MIRACLHLWQTRFYIYIHVEGKADVNEEEIMLEHY